MPTCHHDTKRNNKPFFALNCAAISPNLVEPTLFGYAKGAFTGAVTAKAGYFEDAADGTLFLMKLASSRWNFRQNYCASLKTANTSASEKPKSMSSRARIIAATNRDLRKEVRSGSFRADLYHRISVFSINVPPLREMGDDKLLLLEHFRQRYATPSHPAFELSEEARALWSRYSFPASP